MSRFPRGQSLTNRCATALRGPFARRILTKEDLIEVARLQDQTVGSSVIARLVDNMVDAGMLQKVRRGLFVNRACVNAVSLEELGEHVHPKAIVSLHSALRDVCRNPPQDIWLVVPTEWVNEDGKSRRSVTGTVTWPDMRQSFRVSGIQADVLYAPDEEDLLLDHDLAYPRATPEAAICHWQYLHDRLSKSNHGRGDMSAPRTEGMDLDAIDHDRLIRIGTAMGIAHEVDAWYESVRSIGGRDKYDDGDAAPGWAGP